MSPIIEDIHNFTPRENTVYTAKTSDTAYKQFLESNPGMEDIPRINCAISFIVRGYGPETELLVSERISKGAGIQVAGGKEQKGDVTINDTSLREISEEIGNNLVANLDEVGYWADTADAVYIPPTNPIEEGEIFVFQSFMYRTDDQRETFPSPEPKKHTNWKWMKLTEVIQKALDNDQVLIAGLRYKLQDNIIRQNLLDFCGIEG